MGFTRIDLDNVSEEELLFTIKDNIRTAKLMEEEIKKLREASVTLKNKSTLTEEVEEKLVDVDMEKNVDTDFEDEVDYYLTQLNSLKSSSISDIRDILPVKSNYNYESIIMRLMAELFKNVKDIKDMLTDDGLSKEDIMLLREDLLLEDNKIKAIRTINSLKEESNNKENKIDNRLIFVPMKSGNIRVLDELDSIDKEYYEGFIKLFTSIKDGSFMNVKRFVSSNRETAGFCEVKDFKIRVVFDRIGKNSYAVITSFVNKSDNDKGYIQQLGRKIGEYKQISSTLKENLNNEEFIKLNKEYEEELFNKLCIGQSDKKLVKEVK